MKITQTFIFHNTNKLLMKFQKTIHSKNYEFLKSYIIYFFDIIFTSQTNEKHINKYFSYHNEQTIDKISKSVHS